jgi:hypothetical protein
MEAIFQLEPDQLGGELPPELAAAVQADPALAEELEALRRLDMAMPQMGRLDVPEAFFQAQEGRILAAVETQQPVMASWRAPAGSLVLMLGVVGLYLAAGSEAGAIAARGWSEVLVLDMATVPFAAVYLSMLALALQAFRLDEADASAASGASARS